MRYRCLHDSLTTFVLLCFTTHGALGQHLKYVTTPAIFRHAEVNTAQALTLFERLRGAYPDLQIELDTAFHSGVILVQHQAIPIGPCHGGALSESELDSASLCDQLAMPYTAGKCTLPQSDAGRARSEFFLRAAYGATDKEVQAHCVAVQWFDGSSMPITTVNHVDRHVAAIVEELRKDYDSLHEYFDKPGGSLNWRKVSGAKRLSAHAFGIAIDISVRKTHYWKWSAKTSSGGATRQADIPWRIVECFERHGFIWGGKWTHGDSMHFEFRPELCPPRCSCSSSTLRRPPGAG